VAEGDRRLGEDFGCRHDALTTGADDEDVGNFRHETLLKQAHHSEHGEHGEKTEA